MASRATHIELSCVITAATDAAVTVEVAASGAIEAAQRVAETMCLPLLEAAGRIAVVAVIQQ